MRGGLKTAPRVFKSAQTRVLSPFYPPPPGEEGCQAPTRSLIGKERQRSDTTDTRGRSMRHSKLLPLVISALIGQPKASARPISILYCRTFAPSPRPEPSFPYLRNTLLPPQNPLQPIEPALFTHPRTTLPPPQNPRLSIEPAIFPHPRTTLLPPQNPQQPIEPALFTYQKNTLPPPQNPRQPIEPLFFPYQRTFLLPTGDFTSAPPPTA